MFFLLLLLCSVVNTKEHHKAGIPCLGGLPFIGAAFSKTHKNDEKRNVIIFVRPHIIRSFQDYQKVTQAQEEKHRNQSNKEEFDSAVQLLQGT